MISKSWFAAQINWIRTAMIGSHLRDDLVPGSTDRVENWPGLPPTWSGPLPHGLSRRLMDWKCHWCRARRNNSTQRCCGCYIHAAMFRPLVHTTTTIMARASVIAKLFVLVRLNARQTFTAL